jgi:putative phosphoesterase
MNVAILSDTHIPSRAQRIPEAFRERIREADHVIHAGDFDAESTIADLRELSNELTAVAGNMDPRVGLPSVASVELGGVRPNHERPGSGDERGESAGVEFVVTHGTGSARGYEDRVANAARQHGDEGAIAISGHSHEVRDRVHNGVRRLNPGSATGASPATRPTMMTADVADGDIDVTLHEL